MSKTQSNLVVDYLRLTDSTVDKEHLKAIRNHYRQVLQLPTDVVLPEDPDEDAITKVARLLNLQFDTEEARDCLRECVRYEDIDDTITAVSAKLDGEVKSIDIPPPLPIQLPSRITKDLPHITENSTIITNINCSLNVKMATTEVEEFIHSFLLQDAKALCQQTTTY
jgi:hypothetical protein